MALFWSLSSCDYYHEGTCCQTMSA